MVTRSSASSGHAPARTGDPDRIATGTATSLAGDAGTLTPRDCNSLPMTDHDDVVRQSFTRQVDLFSGPDSPFVRRQTGTATERLEPLDAEMLALDVACGAGHAA